MPEGFCALCQQEIAPGETTSGCPGCGTAYHAGCHEENGGCGTYGCPHVPRETAQTSAAPLTFWGQETKPCSACGQDIKAAAVRCRHCGATFTSAEPAAAGTQEARRSARDDQRRLRRRAAIVFVGGLIPFALPIVLLAAVPLLRRRGGECGSGPGVPPLDRFLYVAGLSLSVVWVGLGLAVYLVSRG